MATKKRRFSRRRRSANKTVATGNERPRSLDLSDQRDCVTIYCDGSCAPTNPGPGGWSFVVPQGDYASGGISHGTNNQAELISVVQALVYASQHHEGKKIRIVSDSQYVIKGSSEWMPKWKRNGWRTKTGNVKNVDFWKQIDNLLCVVDAEFDWVKGHNGSKWNELADSLANEGRVRQSRVFIAGPKATTIASKEPASCFERSDGLPGCAHEDYLW